MPKNILRFCFLSIFSLFTVSIMLVSSTMPSDAQQPDETIAITIIFDQANLALTIRIDGDVENLDITPMTFRVRDGDGNERNFRMSDLGEIHEVLQNAATGDCIQLYGNNPVQFHALCTGTTTPYPLRLDEIFWNPQAINFTVYQRTRSIANCSTTDAAPCSMNWNAPIPPPATDAPSANTIEETSSAPNDSASALPENEPIISENLALEPMPTSRFRSTDGNMVLIFGVNSLTLLVTSEVEVSLVGLQYHINVDGVLKTYDLQDFFDGASVAQPNDCYILERQYTMDVAPLECMRVTPVEVSTFDVFWYDSDRNMGNSVSILNTGNPVHTCPYTRTGCPFFFEGGETGHFIDIYYDQTHLTLINHNEHTLGIAPLRMKPVNASGTPTGRSSDENEDDDNGLWEQFSILGADDGCIKFNIRDLTTTELVQCSSESPPHSIGEDAAFWLSHEDATEIVFSWRGAEIGRCPIASLDGSVSQCQVIIPYDPDIVME